MDAERRSLLFAGRSQVASGCSLWAMASRLQNHLAAGGDMAMAGCHLAVAYPAAGSLGSLSVEVFRRVKSVTFPAQDAAIDPCYPPVVSVA